MAIDGIKILDSDSAYDVYNDIMDRFHYSESIDSIKQVIDSAEKDLTYNDLEAEFYFTSYALAMWEIGALNDALLQKVRDIAAKGASSLWDRIDAKAREKRQKVLDTFLQKIEQPNPKVKKSRNYKYVTDFVFQPNDVLIFRLADGNYAATILIDTFHDRGQCYYDFTEVILKNREKPVLEDIINAKVFARKNIGFDNPKTVSHKNLKKFSGEFEKIGVVNIREKDRRIGGMSPKSTFEEFRDDWNWMHKRIRPKIYALKEFLE